MTTNDIDNGNIDVDNGIYLIDIYDRKTAAAESHGGGEAMLSKQSTRENREIKSCTNLRSDAELELELFKWGYILL